MSYLRKLGFHKHHLIKMIFCLMALYSASCFNQSSCQYKSISGTLSEKDQKKLEQMIPPIKYRDTDFIIVIQDIVNITRVPIKVRICDKLKTCKISIETLQPMKLADILKVIADQLPGNFSLTTGLHGEIAKPVYDCSPFDSHITDIEKEASTE